MSNDLGRLIRFFELDEAWSEALDEVMDEHTAPALGAMGLEATSLDDILDDHWMGILFGCSLEDFLTAEFEPGRVNPADDYLKRRGWADTPGARQYIRAIRGSVMSLYEVSEITPGKSFLARDLIRGGEPVLVSEKLATQSLRPWDKLAARLVPEGQKLVMTGGMLPFTSEAADELIKFLEKPAVVRETRRAKKGTANEATPPPAAIFTTACLMDFLPKATGVHRPIICNSDGDEILYHDARFPLAKGAKVTAVAAALNRIDGLKKVNSRLWEWVSPPPHSVPPKPHETTHEVWSTVNQVGETVLGNIALKDGLVQLSTNSAARSARGSAMLRAALGALIGEPLTEIRTLDQAIHGEAPSVEHEETMIAPELAEQITRDFLEKHYRALLDQPVPMLGNVSPRQAVRSAKGRANTAAWLKSMENKSGRLNDPKNLLSSYDFRWMWAELGIEDLRR